MDRMSMNEIKLLLLDKLIKVWAHCIGQYLKIEFIKNII